MGFTASLSSSPLQLRYKLPLTMQANRGRYVAGAFILVFVVVEVYMGATYFPRVYEDWSLSNTGTKDEGTNNNSGQQWQFPVWKGDGIRLEPLLDRLNDTLDTLVFFPRFPDTLYVIESRNHSSNLRMRMWTSKTIRAKHPKWLIRDRIQPAESLFVDSLLYLDQELARARATDDATITPTSNNRWAALSRALQNGGFPFLVDYEDFTGCARHNDDQVSLLEQNDPPKVPFFTLCAQPTCNYSFPFPTYVTVGDSQVNSSAWMSILAGYELLYPWNTKERMAIWRGSFTGVRDPGNVRRRMHELARNNTNTMSVEEGTVACTFHSHLETYSGDDIHVVSTHIPCPLSLLYLAGTDSHS